MRSNGSEVDSRTTTSDQGRKAALGPNADKLPQRARDAGATKRAVDAEVGRKEIGLELKCCHGLLPSCLDRTNFREKCFSPR